MYLVLVVICTIGAVTKTTTKKTSRKTILQTRLRLNNEYSIPIIMNLNPKTPPLTSRCGVIFPIPDTWQLTLETIKLRNG